MSPALMKTKGHIFLARCATRVDSGMQSLDVDEVSSVVFLSESEIEKKVLSQEFDDMFSVAGYLLAKRAMLT